MGENTRKHTYTFNFATHIDDLNDHLLRTCVYVLLVCVGVCGNENKFLLVSLLDEKQYLCNVKKIRKMYIFHARSNYKDTLKKHIDHECYLRIQIIQDLYNNSVIKISIRCQLF